MVTGTCFNSSLYPLLPTPTRWILTPWESGDRQGGLFSEPGGYLYSLSTCLCVPEIQNPHLEVSYCMSQNRGDTRYSTGLFQTPTSALTVQCSPIIDYLVEILLTAPTTTTITWSPSEDWLNWCFLLWHGPWRKYHHSCHWQKVSFLLIQPNGFSPAKLLDLRKMSAHWVPSSP